ncbi:hypothetical protein ATJ88_2832 [Isoptericola jiangsuensis]|uniref:Uncharacterized protein n=1 Tax=Isoptericola jiangsuensis TaxID=548579 RepID=A0A2A9EYG7_9MICO|nr:DUF6221 family protein [Isoptericola jiangsuensis]PFG44114.1 hypothetical protein ATJ88_2832 [Isoptericola jiangsuensis]
MSITEFLERRLDEDEKVAGAADLVSSGLETPPFSSRYDELTDHILRWRPSRVLAEIRARRHMLELAYEATGLDMDRDLDRALGSRERSGVAYVGDRMLRSLAMPYADHPDYDEAWRL